MLKFFSHLQEAMTPDVGEPLDIEFGFVVTCEAYREVPSLPEFIPLKISCPCSDQECSTDQIITWRCWNEDCKDILLYDCRGYIYCKCGQVKIENCEFLCPHPGHTDFSLPDRNRLLSSTQHLKLLESMNILVLGDTGVGKSTFINGFANFLSYGSLEEAKTGGMKSLIPTQFTVYTKDHEEIIVCTGSSENEIHTAGHSATQTARVYPLKTNTRVIRVIDTPGIGDSRGPIRDKQNFENILATISELDELHGICILLKPNNARLNVFFRFCIKELLTHLHREASKNIIFCFTNSRSTFYRPGDTMPALIALLKEDKTANIPIGHPNIFCYDSEAYRFLAAIKNNPPVTFSEAEYLSFCESWTKSTEETNRMIEYISHLKPHTIKNTLDLNNTRQLVLKLARPLAEINRNIQINKKLQQDYMAELKLTQGSVIELEKKRMITQTVIKTEPLDHPKTVCSNSKCVKVWNLNGNLTTNEYITVCHKRCHLSGIQADSIGPPELLNCNAMGNSQFCRHCTHSYREHLHIYYDSVLVQEQVVNESIDELLKSGLSDKERNEKLIHEQIQKISEFEAEIKQIERSCAYFANFLKNNAIAPYNDALDQYLDHVINEEKEKVANGGSRQVLDELIKSKKSYSEQKRILEESLSARHGETSAKQTQNEDIWKLVEDLKKLKHAGNSLKDAINCIHQTQNTTNVSAYATASNLNTIEIPIAESASVFSTTLGQLVFMARCPWRGVKWCYHKLAQPNSIQLFGYSPSPKWYYKRASEKSKKPNTKYLLLQTNKHQLQISRRDDRGGYFLKHS